MPELILASGSPYKRALLARLGVEFSSESADIDESSQAHEAPEETARRLARKKAEAIAKRRTDAWVLGADQVIALGDKRFSKPKTAERAREQLTELSGKTHRLFTAVALVTPHGRLLEDAVDYEMHMRALTPEEITAYVDEDEPFGCAGSYKIEAGGIRLFRALRGDDYTAIVGLPLTRVFSLLERGDFFERGER